MNLAMWRQAAGSLLAFGLAQSAVSSAPPRFDYILWCGHRFGRTPEQQERDLRYYADLGFTHSLVGGRMTAKECEEQRSLFSLFAKYGMKAGLRYGWDTSWLDRPRDKEEEDRRLEAGYFLMRERKGFSLHFNPLHPDIIAGFAQRFGESAALYRTVDSQGVIRLFLIGSEHTFPLPPADQCLPAAKAIILSAAREDGVLKANEEDWGKLSAWWESPKGKGRDWRLRLAIQSEIRKHFPEAEFMIDPVWAVKLPGDTDFGGTWSYLGEGDVEGIAVKVVRIKAQCWPNPATHSTQLIRGASHHRLLAANFLSLCLGIDKLYHWGLNTFEPGRWENPGYGRKDVKASPPEFPMFALDPRAGEVADWGRLLELLNRAKSTSWGRRIWNSLEEETRRWMESAELEGLVGKPIQPEEPRRRELLAALNRAMEDPDLFDLTESAKLPLNERAKVLAGRIKEGAASELERREWHRLALEAALTGGLVPTSSPNILELREGIERDRREKEAAIRTTGRFLRERGALLKEWKPMVGVVLLDGIYGSPNAQLALILGQIPFVLMRNPYHRVAEIPHHRVVLVAHSSTDSETYTLLAQVLERGGTVFLPKGFRPPEGQALLPGAREWDLESAMGSSPEEVPFSEASQEHFRRGVQYVRERLTEAGYRPYFDSPSWGLVIRAYVFRDQPVLMAVNIRRNSTGEFVPNTVEILVRDPDEDLRVRNVETGEERRMKKTAEGGRFSDTLAPASYGLYAVLRAGRLWDGPPPLPSGPAVREVRAEPCVGGVRLAWKIDVPDWVGCDVQQVRIWRGDAPIRLEPLETIYAREVRGPGGLIETYLDRSIADKSKGPLYYAVETISPLGRPGPRSSSVRVF